MIRSDRVAEYVKLCNRQMELPIDADDAYDDIADKLDGLWDAISSAEKAECERVCLGHNSNGDEDV